MEIAAIHMNSFFRIICIYRVDVACNVLSHFDAITSRNDDGRKVHDEMK